MSVTIPVEAGQIMILARALGDDNPAYADPASAEAQANGGVIAPPTFTELRFHYQARSAFRARYDAPWYGSGREPTGTPGEHPNIIEFAQLREGQVAMPGEIKFDYLEPIRAGDTITMTETVGDSWTKQTAVAGEITFIAVKREYRNQHGAIAVIEQLTFVVMEKVEGFQ